MNLFNPRHLVISTKVFFLFAFFIISSRIFGQGELCFIGTNDPTKVSAKSEWTIDPIANTVKIRTTFAKTFVDNTYGTNTIGWPNGHKFSDLVGSDKLQLALYNNSKTKILEFEMDYITSTNTVPSGYKSLGVSGGEGSMIFGNAANVLNVITSLDVNFNQYNYVLTTNSPSTNSNYDPNAANPLWIYDVWYEVTVKLSAFGASGFGFPLIASVHASPSKTGNNTEPVDSLKCPNNLNLTIQGNCIKDCTEDIISTVNSSHPPFTYLWSTGAKTKDIFNVCAGTYSLTVTDAISKVLSSSVVVTDDACPSDELCFKSSTGDTRVGARSEWTINPSKKTVTIRTTFLKTFVDNTYGANAIGWPSGHTFSNLVGSDHIQLALYDKNGVKKLEFKEDYITADASAPSGYNCLGVTGGEGQMILGNSSSILDATSSLDVNFNTYGYVLTANSPSTNASYLPNPTYPNWIYEVWYETTVDLNAFGAAGFGFPLISNVHASPSKTGNNTEPVDSMKCPNEVELTIDGNCIQDCTEDIIATVNSSHPPFTYLWSTGARTKDLLNVCAGNYSLTVTDANSKTATASVSVTDESCPGGEICFKSSVGDDRVGARSEWTINGTKKTVTIRTIFNKTFVDNTYGTNVIGWPSGHTFSNLVGSDHLQLALYDKNGVKKLEFKEDYITASNTTPSGYDCLGVSGGEGQMIIGNSSSILNSTSSLDLNFNSYGYILNTNSPSTNTNYDPNPTYPNWIYEVWYEVTVDLNVFGAAGFGFPLIASVHASPSKTGNNTEPVDSMKCTTCVIKGVTTNPGICNSNSNTYSVTGMITFNTNINKGTLIIDDGIKQKILFPPFISPVSYTLLDLIADGNVHTLTAKFSADTTCKFIKTYSAPTPCNPKIIHEKTLISVTRTGINSYNVLYGINVINSGGAGIYDLKDRAAFDDDIIINSATYFSNAPGNPGGPLIGAGPWFLANDQSISANSSHQYNILFNVNIDLNSNSTGNNIYYKCGQLVTNRPASGEALFNESQLDLNNDGNPEQRDTACGELPFIIHEKNLVGVVQTGVRSFEVTYNIIVKNLGGISDNYALTDRPAFDNDIVINNVNYSSNAAGNLANPGPISLFGTGPWTLANNQLISGGGLQSYTIRVNVTINLEDVVGDNRYDRCGRQNTTYPISGEGLFNESRLDIISDGNIDQRDTACADLPYIIHDKSIIGVTDLGSGNYRVLYRINVNNIGGASGTYDLSDASNFDDDILILNANYTTNASGHPANPGPLSLFGIGPWTLANDQLINGFSSQSYTLAVNVNIDLVNAASVGDEIYKPCGYSIPGIPRVGEGFFNESRLDINNDGTPDQKDTACADIPKIIHTKSLVGVTPTGINTYQVEYKITVENKGGVSGTYNLYDAPNFENDITILSTNYSSNAIGNVANPGPVNLIGTGPWSLATNQTIGSGGIQMYNIRVNVRINLEGGGGDERYDACGRSNQNYPSAGEGLFNESRLDVNSDGSIDERDTACADLPYIIHEKSLVGVIQTGTRSFEVTYRIDVRNLGSIGGVYALTDRTAFDNDIVINNVNYSSNAAGNVANPGPISLFGTGPWTLANNQFISGGGVQTYTLRVNVTIHLSDVVGDNRYDRCSKQFSTYPISGEGLFNESRLDINSDGFIDQKDTACGDIPYIIHQKALYGGVIDLGNGNYRVQYKIDVKNIGGGSGYYDLDDDPSFDDDITILNSNYSFASTIFGVYQNNLSGSGPWVLARNQRIDVGDNQFYIITVDVKLDLSAQGPGDHVLRDCGYRLGIPSAGEALFNKSLLSYNRVLVECDTACGTIPVCSMISGRVFFDVNTNGIFDYNENGINGLEVYLVDATSGNVITKQLTTVNPATPSDDGYYMFGCVKPGTYFIRFERPGFLAASAVLQGGNPDKDSDIGHENGINTTRLFYLSGGEKYLNIGAGFQNKAMVGDFVFLDANLNGIQDQGDQPVEGVMVYAYNKTTGAIISESMSGNDGHYMLDGISKGDYFVKFVPPSNLGFTVAHNNSDAIDSDVDGTNGYGTTRVYRIQSGEEKPTIDAGLVYQLLPLEWLSFTGTLEDTYTKLIWQTGVELNNDHFEIERRFETEKGYSVIGKHPAQSNGASSLHKYNFDDFDINEAGVYYYRLKQVDKNGLYTYSKVISVSINRHAELSANVFPNPVDNLLNVQVNLGTESELEVRVYDKSGKNVLTNPFSGFRKAGKYDELINTSALKSGVYNLQIITSMGIVNKQFTVLR